jgi:hypothetical protein
MKSSLILPTVMFLTVVLGFGQQAQERKLVRLEDAKTVDVSTRVRFDNAVRAMDAIVTPVPTVLLASHFAMIRTAGTVGDDVATGIIGIVHTTIPRGSLIGLRVRRFDGTTQVEGVTSWDRDLTPGEGFVVKSPGGGMFFNSTKQYEMVVFDPITLVTTVDYIPVVTGNGPFINGAQVGLFAGNTVLRLYFASNGTNVDAIVINGIIVPPSVLAWDSTNGNTFMVDLTRFAVCFGSGDVSVTVTMGGQSDTTQFRFPQGMTQSCGGPTPLPSVPQG